MKKTLSLFLVWILLATNTFAAIPTSIGDLSSTPASNSPAGTDVIGTSLDDYLRAIQAILRQESLDTEWVLPETAVAYASSTSFTISGEDVTTIYSVGRRVQAVGNGTGTIYGKISSSVWDTVDTIVTVVWDSGNLTNEDLTVYLGAIKGSATGALSGNARSLDFDALTLHGSDIASASTVDLDSAKGNIIDITGTTTITGITLAEGRMRVVRFTGILTLTNGASLVLPNGVNITTAAGDFAIFVGYSGGIVRCVSYSRVPVATETLSGTAEIATQAETDTGTNDTNFITPLKLASATSIGGGFKSMQVFTSSGTWTKPAGINKVLVYVVGGGGSGGGGDGGNAAGGGGGGGACIKFITSGLGSTEAITVGAGGAGVSEDSNGNTGGTSSFGSHCSATGGAGAIFNGYTPGGSGGVGSGGDLNIKGGAGGSGSGDEGLGTAGGSGGNSIFQGGGRGGGSGSGGGIGEAGSLGGGSGGNAGTENLGSPGGSGVVIVYEYS